MNTPMIWELKTAVVCKWQSEFNAYVKYRKSRRDPANFHKVQKVAHTVGVTFNAIVRLKDFKSIPNYTRINKAILDRWVEE